MIQFLLKSFVVVASLFLSAWGGHLLTFHFLSLTGLFPPSHDDRQQRISMWIGISERLVISVLTMFGAIVVTVFVFATKAAVMATRLDGVGQVEKRQITEFILIGTMVSYLFGMLFGLGGQAALDAVGRKFSTPQPISVKIVPPFELNGCAETRPTADEPAPAKASSALTPK